MSDRMDHRFTRQIAQSDFESAFRKGFWRKVIGWLTLSENKLQPFDEVIKQFEFNAQRTIGNKTVPIENITGSVGRYRDFDNIFLPKQSRTRDRWVRIDEAHLTDTPLPAVELYKIGDEYFVKDGNHRVSVARERGQKFIDAYVIEIDLEKPEKEMDLIERILKQEKKEFEQKTRIREITETRIDLSHLGGYAKLLEHIKVHRWFLGEQRNHEVGWEEAVASWYQDVYYPLICVIRDHEVMREFPEQREADLYLWIIEHLWYLREAYRQEISLDEAASHFTEEFSQRSLRWITKFFHNVASSLTEKKD